MSSYLLKLLSLLLFSILIAVFYYSIGAHQESFSGYSLYGVLMLIIYAIYKTSQIYSSKPSITFTPLTILNYFLLHLFVVCGVFFTINDLSFGTAIVLFFKILYFCLLPVFLVFISLWFWKKIYTCLFSDTAIHTAILKFIISLLIGFISFVTLLTILWFFGLYSLWSVFFISIIFIWVAYKQIWYFTQWIWSYEINFDNTYNSNNKVEKVNMNLATAELFFIVIALLLSINLISIMRPFPIGWDDLWAYMNFPRLMAAGWEVGFLWSMMSWSVFTGIGYLFENPVQAFFLNNVWGFLSVIVLVLIVSDALSSSTKKTFLHIPTLTALLFISLPMIVFQQAKDMKIDPGLFFMSVSSVYILYNTLVWEYKKKQKYVLFWLIWIFLWFLFTVKFTTLLTVISALGVMFYRYLWWSGVWWYFALFIWIFTRLWLWSYMNVSYPSESEIFKNSVLLVSVIIAAVSFAYSFVQNKKIFTQTASYILIVCLWVFIGMLPWVGNNIVRSWDIWVSSILAGKTDRFIVDFNTIHTSEKLAEIEKNKIDFALSSSGTTKNEDLGRYFWYEQGINNYIKLPWNLTMQLNQWGEFTNIGWLFLAFIPGLFLFLPTRKINYIPVIVWACYGSIFLLFLYPPSRVVLTQLLSQISLPGWYGVILWLFILPLVWLITSLNTEKKYIKLFIYNLVFSAIYMFLWAISAFGIVWYGIVMYFNMLFMIAICLYYVSVYNFEHIKKTKVHLLWSVTILMIICIWIFSSVMPHSFKNIKAASYTQFKTWHITTVNAPFLYHRDYAAILFALNIGQENFEIFIDSTVEPLFIEKTPDIKKYNISKTIGILNQIINTPNIDIVVKRDAEKSLNNIYKKILSPDSKLQNDKNIYRVGTFLKYFITKNDSRLSEDSLLGEFQTYIYDQDPNITADNFKKAGLDYLLVDLNAATIDKDPAKKLTGRMDDMFTTFTADNLELIETDSICLRTALDVYKINRNIDEYQAFASVNHNSVAYNRISKFQGCHNAIYGLISQNLVSNENFSYLLPLVNHLNTNNLSSELEIKKYLWWVVSHWYKALFKIK